LATDDGPTIQAAKMMGIPFATAIHFVIDICRGGDMPLELALAKLEKLERFGRYHPRIMQHARTQFEGRRK